MPKLMLLIITVVSATVGYAYSIPNCRNFTTCSSQVVSNGCRWNIKWIQCDGSNGSSTGGCYNVGCVRRNCTCECEYNGSTLVGFDYSWCDCNDVIHTVTMQCSGWS